tara:strand:- start:3260 stop:3475 length:216 start_codon:yes stop_codon:yes gene_type:complete
MSTTRLDKIEWTLDRHDESITNLRDVSKELKTSLNSIERSLIQIKWFAVGGLAVIFADQFGLMGLLKAIGI